MNKGGLPRMNAAGGSVSEKTSRGGRPPRSRGFTARSPGRVMLAVALAPPLGAEELLVPGATGLFL